jgi:hypothetical protein
VRRSAFGRFAVARDPLVCFWVLVQGSLMHDESVGRHHEGGCVVGAVCANMDVNESILFEVSKGA